MDKILNTINYLKERIENPEIGIILGSGLGDLADLITEQISIPYAEIPGFPQSTVDGHRNRLVSGYLGEKKVLAMQGRFHYYEGYDLNEVTLPVRVMQALGVKILIITNAAGGLNPQFRPGDLMLIKDHINFVGLNPLRGANQERWGPRFPDMTYAYDPTLRNLAQEAAGALDLPLQQGVYIWVSGPSYETPAEVNCLRKLGGDAVGMSTVPEVIVGNHSGLQVLGISFITNVAAGITGEKLDHDDVIATAEKGKKEFQNLIIKIIEMIE